MHLKSLRLYILFLLVALGYQTEGCVLYKVLYKAENRAREIPCPVIFIFVVSLNRAKNFEHKHDNTRSIEPEYVEQVIKDRYSHKLHLRKACHRNPRRYVAEQCFLNAFICLYL